MKSRILMLACSLLIIAGVAGCGGSDCTPTTCAEAGGNCGELPDGCGGTVACGTCSGGENCGGGGPNVCGVNTCSPTTCPLSGFECGIISNNCDNVLDCGTCERPEICGIGGRPNICSLPPSESGMCADECLRQPDAFCCLECGCQQQGCNPVCSDGFFWDCEQQCCFSSDSGCQ